MATATEVKKGNVLELDGELFQVVDLSHRTPGNKRGFVQMKIKNLRQGGVLERRFSSTERVEVAFIETRIMEYLYQDGENYNFMDTETYEQYLLSQEVVGDLMPYVVHNSQVKVICHQGNPISIELPAAVVLTITETDPGAKGDTVSNVFKPATLETGLVLKVPMYMETGQKVKVDTRTGDFLERVNE